MNLLRIEYAETGIGMWSTKDENDVPLVAQLTNQVIANLPMPDSDVYRRWGKKWYSACASVEGLRGWFSEADVLELLDLKFQITQFDSPRYMELAMGEFIFPKEDITNFKILTMEDIY